MLVEVIPMLSDNYGYLLTQPGTDEAVVVDPSEAAPVRRLLSERKLKLHTILATHHHPDHVGGTEELVVDFPDAAVVASHYDREAQRIPKQTHELRDGETWRWRNVALQALHVPAHTLGALAYFGEGCLFTGDTWFIGGCGRVFEGTHAQMHAAIQRLAALPADTRIYCGHDYAVKNLSFCVANGAPAEARLAAMKERLARCEPSVPASIADERASNVFVGCDLDRFSALRHARDVY